MGVITQLVNAIESDEIREHVNNNVDVGLVYCGDWEVEMHHVNIYLNKLLEKKLHDSSNTITPQEHQRARSVLRSVQDERDIPAWVNGLTAEYFPVLGNLWE